MGGLRPELAAVRGDRSRRRGHRLRPPFGPRPPGHDGHRSRGDGPSRRSGCRPRTPTSRSSEPGWKPAPVVPTPATPAPSTPPSHRHGCFTEHDSPTYYGVDLLALGLWQRDDAPRRAAAVRGQDGSDPVARRCPLVARRARQPLRPLLPRLWHGPQRVRQRPVPRPVVRRPPGSPARPRPRPRCPWPRPVHGSRPPARRRPDPQRRPPGLRALPWPARLRADHRRHPASAASGMARRRPDGGCRGRQQRAPRTRPVPSRHHPLAAPDRWCGVAAAPPPRTRPRPPPGDDAWRSRACRTPAVAPSPSGGTPTWSPSRSRPPAGASLG